MLGIHDSQFSNCQKDDEIYLQAPSQRREMESGLGVEAAWEVSPRTLGLWENAWNKPNFRRGWLRPRLGVPAAHITNAVLTVSQALAKHLTYVNSFSPLDNPIIMAFAQMRK